MQGLLSDAMPQEPLPPEAGGMVPQGGMSDVDMAVEGALAGGEMEDMGFGAEMASPEEEALLQKIMDEIEKAMHGDASQNVSQVLKTIPEKAEAIARTAENLIMGSFSGAARNGLAPNADVYLAENGVVQETVELVFEMAEAMGQVNMNDDETLSAAYFLTLKGIGEIMLGAQDPEIRESAQEYLAELELGVPVNPSDYAEEGEVPMSAQGMGMEQQMAQGQPQAPSEAPLPPMGPPQGMI